MQLKISIYYSFSFLSPNLIQNIFITPIYINEKRRIRRRKNEKKLGDEINISNVI
jgi:hypothetical protein